MSFKEWEEVRLGDVVDSISNKHKFNNTEIVLINTSDVFDGKVLNHSYVENKNLKGQFKKSFQKGDILYSEIRPKNRRFAYVDFDATDYVASTKLMVLRKKCENVDSKFLFQILKSENIINKLQSLAETRSGTFPQITFTELTNLKVPLPYLKEQKAIANILSTLDEKIEVNNQINKKLEEMAQTIFKQWFVDFEFPNEDGEPYKSSGGEMIESELRMIPRGWRVGKFLEFVSVKYGKDHKKLADGKIPVYGSGGIMRYADTAIYSSESVLIPRKGTLNNIIYVNEPFWSVDTMFFTEMKLPYIAKFIYFFMKSKDLVSMNVGSAVPSMTTEVLNNMEIIVSSEEIMKKYDEIVSRLFNKIKANTEENIVLISLRDTLLPKLMSGEIRAPLDHDN